MYIPFNKTTITGNELGFIKKLVKSRHLNSDSSFTKQCVSRLESNTGCKSVFLTSSCTHSLEMCALLADIKPGDEVIMPSFTYVSTANAFALRGAQIVFVDIRPETMNIDERLIEDAVTAKTKAIVPMHYTGIACEMDTIMRVAGKYKVLVFEDAANSYNCSYKNKYLGTIGHLGCYSFDEAKNITCGEGGALLVNEDRFIRQVEIIRENGTDRAQFLRGEIEKYSWQDIGSSYSPNELTAAFLSAQLEETNKITKNRLESWNYYYKGLYPLMQQNIIDLPFVPQHCQHNGHIFFIKLKDIVIRKALTKYLLERNIHAVFHYVPLHSSKGGTRYGRFHGADKWTTRESERLLRLPIYHRISKREIDWVISSVFDFFKEKGK
jgi:dTDP-4-amino-4,6-dideoxygalactose transaminase